MNTQGLPPYPVELSGVAPAVKEVGPPCLTEGSQTARALIRGGRPAPRPLQVSEGFSAPTEPLPKAPSGQALLERENFSNSF